MDTRNLTPEERYELVLECRRSGLTDHQWLEENGIPRSTFYYWLSQFRKKGYPNIPEPLSQSSPHRPQIQEVVKINMLPDEPSDLERNAPSPKPHSGLVPVIEIVHEGTVIRLTNDADPGLLKLVLSSIGGGI